MNNSRRGSALLIVLGMMAFIVVSAVAFSAYMRFSRMPSSYLRRTSSSRLLVKAALAEAINEVDLAIGNNPYPGVGGNVRNRWQSRVFTGTNGLAGTSSTVATLTMEGLAYIPPAFINEVRYYSRRTPTAGWKTLNYDAGRYAYCAVDVSDCLDVNRLIADAGRDSSDEGRIRLSYCFENPAHTGYAIQPKSWESFMEKYSNTEGKKGSKIPFVSVADLNLAMKANGGFDELSPFCKYLDQANNAKMVEDDTDGKESVELQRHLAIITESSFPATNVTDKSLIDLSRSADQPFAGMRVMKKDDLKTNDDTLDNLFDAANSKYKNYLDFPRLVQLYDYLDGDSVPMSLALPTVERTPMVTSVGFNSELIVSVEKKNPVKVEMGKDQMGNPTGYIRVTVGNLKLAGQVGVKVGSAYPFKYTHGKTPTFKAQVAATVTLVPSGSENELRRSRAVSPAVFTRTDWTTSKQSGKEKAFSGEKTPVVVTMQSEVQNIKINNDIRNEDEAVCEDLTFDFDNFTATLTSDFVNALPGSVKPNDDIKKGTFRLVEVLDKDGTTVKNSSFETTLKPSNAEMSGSEEMKADTKYVPVVQLWVRILDENNHVVDLVPACCRDDEKEAEILSEFRSTRERPVLRFWSENTDQIALVNSEAVLDYGEKKAALYPKVYMADDPRFNHAPECLKATTDFGNNFKTAWLAAQRSKNRDGDIFMMTSDAGYLQSVFEMSALLDIEREDLDSGIDGKVRTSFDNMACQDVMWRTWSQCKLGDGNGSDITRAVKFVDSGRGFRVNPFTGDVNIMMAALANTPVDWWAASTNDLGAASAEKQKMLDKLTDANKYTFSEHNGAMVTVKYGTRKNPTGTLMELAQKFVDAFRSNTDWQNEFDNRIDWNAEDKIAGVDLGVTLHSVDKKFLHGYWRECFANRQHLFLIFVRAEPMMMGGGGMGQTPPQLGARAVALVWRDPTPNVKYPSGPHRTRVLFYRQFD